MVEYKTASPDRYAGLKDFARENRKNATLAERVLWENVRNNLLGVRCLRQHIIGDYIVDFYIPDSKLVIEVDGGYHAEREQREDDAVREEILNKMGYRVVRFSNEKVLYDTDKTLETIIKIIGNDR
ncbi:MAG: endonuclease domain-containing protein [Paraprevotella sp.]|nr:endonuclease domain-containing protein [Paraprevotella sp.]